MRRCRLAALGIGVCLTAAAAFAQSNPDNSAANPYMGSVQAVAPASAIKQLSLDDAIHLGIDNNLGLILARENQKQAEAQKLVTLNLLLPTIDVEGSTAFHQYNLAAQGFRPSILPQFAALAPAGGSGSFPLIVKVDVTRGQANFSQQLFNWAGYDLYRAAKSSARSAYYNAESSRGLVILNVGNSYLQALSDRAQIDYARSLLKTDAALLRQAVEEHQAGTVARLDELRARVQYQTQQQSVINAENAFEKDKIALNRQIGLAPGQQIQLTEAAPYSELAALSLDDARRQAFANRQDYQSLRQQIRTAELERSAAKHERWPTLSFRGNYGVTGVSGGIYHGTFAAAGTLNIPVFQEAKFRGDSDVAEAQLDNLRARMSDERIKIEQQLRDSLLDLQTDSQLVAVTRSNVRLANTELGQTIDRFKAGIDDNLPVVQAQSTLAQAQSRYVASVYQFNQAKLGLARNLGIIDTQYKTYLQGGHPPEIKSSKAAQSTPGR